MNISMFGQEFRDALSLVRREIVCNDVDFLPMLVSFSALWHNAAKLPAWAGALTGKAS
jgi:hypothetical protein